MKTLKVIRVAAVLAYVFLLSANNRMMASADFPGDSEKILSLERFSGESKLEIHQVFERRRFPNVVVAMDGTVLTFAGDRNVCPVQVRRSEDGGATWGDIIQIGEQNKHLGAAVVDENTGDILVFDNDNTMYRSSDEGRTWTQESVTIHPDGFGGVGGTHGCDSGITLR